MICRLNLSYYCKFENAFASVHTMWNNDSQLLVLSARICDITDVYLSFVQVLAALQELMSGNEVSFI